MCIEFWRLETDNLQYQEFVPYIQVQFIFKIANVQIQKKLLLEAEHVMRHLQRKLEESLPVLLSMTKISVTSV